VEGSWLNVGVWLGAAEREGSWDKDGSSEGAKDGVPLGSKDEEGFAEGGS